MNLQLPKINSYVDNTTSYQLFKVHGSIDWLREVSGTGGDTLNSAEKLVWTKNYVKGSIIPHTKIVPTIPLGKEEAVAYIHAGDDVIFVPSGHDYVPAIAIPTVTKSSFEFPKTHEEKMISAIQETTKLLIIGWRGAEQHFLELWKKHADPAKLKLVYIVNSDPKRAMEIQQRLINGGITCNTVRFSYKGFSGFVANDLKDFLIEASHIG